MTAFLAPRVLCLDDDLSDFCCGTEAVDDWVTKRAHRAMGQGTAVVYLCKTDEGNVAGVYSLSAHSVQRSDVGGGWLKRNVPEQIPAILLGMLGVNRPFQGEGVGRSLLRDAILRSQGASHSIGARALLVDPVDPEAARFYKQYGFKVLPGSGRLFLPLH